ncbi:MAG TPA: SRPBCC family protein [Devosia sp.]|jgi:uncharacterized protein YndB with AHSA1/START domain|nr:SRPBCC family protein [Devosia sp.]
MAYEFRVSGRIAKPVRDVFEAVVEPKQLSKYFTTGGAQGRLETGATVTWDFHDFPGAFPVHVIEVQQDKKIVLRWDAADGPDDGGQYETTVTMTFEALDDGRTLVAIAEEGFRDGPAGEKAAFGNCEGWTGMLCALKVYVEHGINLRAGFYK